MSLETPTTKQVTSNTVSQIEAAIAQQVPLLPKAFIRVIAKALAGVYMVLYKYCGFIFLQIFPSSAMLDVTEINGVQVSPLTAWGDLVGAGAPAPATQAQVEVVVSVITVGATVLPAGTAIVNPGTGVVYLTTTSVALNAPTVTVQARASSDQAGGNGSGTVGNVAVGETLAMASPIPEASPSVIVVSLVVTGANGESEAAYRARIVQRFRTPPQGGSLADYFFWATDPTGIIGAFPYVQQDCPGITQIFLEATAESSGNADGIPTQSQLEASLNVINSFRPANGVAVTLPITRTAFDVEVTGLSVQNPTATQQDITAALTSYFLEREPYIGGLSIPPRVDRITESQVSGIVDDVVSASGGIFELVNVSVSSAQVGLYTLGQGEKAKAGAVTFV